MSMLNRRFPSKPPSRSSDWRGNTKGLLVACALAMLMAAPALLAQESAAEEEDSAGQAVSDGLLGDDFARDTGAIIVTANRLGRGNLFEAVDIPEDSCLANAPEIGSDRPGFTIDASEMRRVRELERVRRRTRAGTIFVSGGSFVGRDFSDAKLYDMCFFGTDLSQTEWTGLNTRGMGFVDVDLTGADMRRTNLPFVLFRNTKLGLVDASEANWRQGRIDGGWESSLRELNLTRANLNGFEIACGTDSTNGCATDRGGISMASASLRRASFHSFFVSDLNLDGAQIDQTELALDHLQLLKDARLVGPVVLRSPRRAIMLFPGEVSILAELAAAEQDTGSACASPGAGALALICEAPGSAPRALIETVARLEAEAEGRAGYAERLVAWSASRDACMELEGSDQQLACVSQAYRSRRDELSSALGSPSWMRSEGFRLFISREAAYPTNRGRPGLYGRILPILLDSAVAAVMVKTDGRGRAFAKGMTQDGCLFEAEGLRYNTEEATLGYARARRRRSPIFEEPLLGFNGEFARVRDEGLMRAGGCDEQNPFPQLEEIELDHELLTTIWERF